MQPNGDGGKNLKKKVIYNMAQRRMFSLKVVDTDNFLDMSPTAQNLYFHLGMRADDDGFVANPKKIMKFIGAPDDDMKVLIVKGFIIPMATNGVCVITHWKTNNLIKSDRYTETIYLEEKSRLDEKNGVYGYFSDNIVPKIGNGSKMVPVVEPQVRLGKVRLGKVNKDSATSPNGDSRCPNKKEGHKGCIEFIDSVALYKKKKTFTNYQKQIYHLHKMLKAGYTFDEIDQTIDGIDKKVFYQENGWDFATISNELDKL